MCNPSLLLARIIFCKKFSGSMRKIFHEYGFSGIRTCVVGFGSVKFSNAIKETKPKVRHVFTLRHWAALEVYGEFIKFYQTFVSWWRNELSERHFWNQPNVNKSLYLTERTAEKRNLSEQKLGCFTVNARVDLVSRERYSCPSCPQTYFSALIDSFHIFAILEHCLFVEQIELLEASTNYKYKCIAACAEDNPPLLSGKRVHGGVALFWKNTLDDVVTPLEEIDSDRIVEIRCDFNDVNPLFILCVYLPSSSHDIEKFNECLDYLWALFDSLSTKSFVIVIGDLNGDFGNASGDRGFYEPNNNRGLKLLDFANYFNLCPTNLLQICRGPLETFVSRCGRFKSTIDYILLPNCLSDSIVSCKTFEHVIDNTSDHLPITLEINYSLYKNTALFSENLSETSFKNKIRWSNFSFEEITESYAVPIVNDLELMSLQDYNSLANSAEKN